VGLGIGRVVGSDSGAEAGALWSKGNSPAISRVPARSHPGSGQVGPASEERPSQHQLWIVPGFAVDDGHALCDHDWAGENACLVAEFVTVRPFQSQCLGLGPEPSFPPQGALTGTKCNGKLIWLDRRPAVPQTPKSCVCRQRQELCQPPLEDSVSADWKKRGGSISFLHGRFGASGTSVPANPTVRPAVGSQTLFSCGDDLGYGHGWYGQTRIKTPNLIASPRRHAVLTLRGAVCAPSRCA
jgi:hypothetical protein